MRNPFHPPPAPPGFGVGKVVPESNASLLSRLVFQWVMPLLGVGYSRPLEKDDLWELPSHQLTANLTDELEGHFFSQCPPRNGLNPGTEIDSEIREDSKPSVMPTEKDDIEEVARPASDIGPTRRPWFGRLWHKIRPPAQRKPEPKTVTPRTFILKALHRQFLYTWWTAGLFKLAADTLKTTSPLLTKLLLTWLVKSYFHHRIPALVPKPQGIGYGIGIGFALFAMQELASLLTNRYTYTTMSLGMNVRASLVGIIFRKSLRLSGRARVKHNIGQITTMISSDSVRLQRAAATAHSVWISPIQIMIGVGLLIGNLGYSALVGLGVLLLGFPLQFILIRVVFFQRKKGVVFTDQRVKLTAEVLQGIRLIKFYAWEAFYSHRIGELRAKEIRTIKIAAIARAALISVVTFLPVIASTLSFITYALSGHDLNVAIIFSSLQFFDIIRFPLLTFPYVFTIISDALVALGRFSTFLVSEELSETGPPTVDSDAKYAVEVDGDFTWETVNEDSNAKTQSSQKTNGGAKSGQSQTGDESETNNGRESTNPTGEKAERAVTPEETPFELKSLNLKVPRGALVAIVGPVGSGKSSILLSLTGEMRRTRGEVILGGTVAYVPQNAWIQSATLRQNVTFGEDDDEEKFRNILRACCLEHDIEVLPNGEDTEIGEKGINLSGGQKARVSLARAAYTPSDIVLLDDPLSAVDAHVGKAILEDCILSGPLSSRTRILVTHALHVLDRVDHIYVVDKGSIIEEGSYEDLLKDSVVFSRLIAEYGQSEQNQDTKAEDYKESKKGAEKPIDDEKKAVKALMQVEDRNFGSVEWGVYSKYLRFAGGIFWAPVILGFLAFAQAAAVGNILFLGFWTANSIPHFKRGHYIAVYAALGAAQAISSFFLNLAFSLASLVASLTLFKAALTHVLRSRVSFFDTTPMGRILSRLSKDQDVLDSELSLTMFQLMYTAASILGSVALVFYTFPYLGIIFLPLALLYQLVSSYYRRTSVETKRLESVLRSTLYSSFSETLTGLPTIRAYRAQDRSIQKTEHGMDLENRAYFATLSIQRWLSVRLDLFGNILVLGIVMFAVGFRFTVNPSKIGVVLAYTLGVTQFFSDLINHFAQNEQNMNAVERVLVFAELPGEGAITTSQDPPSLWPANGLITFANAELAYREGLPLVLKGVSFEVKPGEKVGIVGRTGAGKSSLLQALFRIVELKAGSITIDGYDISKVGLDTLRGRLALVPQDSVLFSGTLRENLDPQGTLTDAELISCLQRAWLLPKEGETDSATEAKFGLDAPVGEEGSNFSAGEKQLLALCRALIKGSRIIVLDEATSNVDVETDSKLQRTIRTELTGSTLLCVAHRLNTIAYYDRVLVMDNGHIAEFDTVLNLFDARDSIFRSLCDEAGLSRQDILRIRADGLASDQTS